MRRSDIDRRQRSNRSHEATLQDAVDRLRHLIDTAADSHRGRRVIGRYNLYEFSVPEDAADFYLDVREIPKTDPICNPTDVVDFKEKRDDRYYVQVRIDLTV